MENLRKKQCTDAQTTLNIYTHLERQVLFGCSEMNRYYDESEHLIS